MSRAPIATDRLDSWKAIASYIGRDVRTVIRWERQRGLPIHRVPGGGRQVVFAYPHEIDEWLESGHTQSNGATDQSFHERELSIRSLQAQSQVAAVVEANREVETVISASPWSHSAKVWFARAAIAGALVGLAFFAILRPALQRRYIFAGETQVTNDGAPKLGLVTDGANLYFGEWREGRLILSTVSAQGGPVRKIFTPFIQTEPLAVSNDGRQLLVLAGEGMEQERTLWDVPLKGGFPQRVGNFLCHSAAWSPDGHRIAFAFANAIYMTASNGASQQQIQAFAGVPDHLHWSLDGKRILFLLRDEATQEAVPWEITLSGASPVAVTALAPLTRAPMNYATISSVLDSEDNTFLDIKGSNSSIRVLEKPRWPWSSNSFISNFTKELSSTDDFAVDTNTQQLYCLRSSLDNGELDWFDKKSHEFHPFLPGIAARDVDFSRDGRSIVYVQVPQHKLWVATADGSLAKQINTPGMVDVELPRWSPDGKQIAFMGRGADAPWRIYVVFATGENLHEASHGADNQGAPTWSPDSRRLVYGRVECQETRTCAIGKINLRTGEQTVVEGSDGLSTARWSPNGRYIAALRADRFQVFLLDRQTREWRKLAEGVNGNDLAWSPDSNSVYASRPGGDRPEVIRISVRDGRTEPVIDLTNFCKLSGRVDTWFAVTPDDSILFLREVSGNEVYALHYIER